MSDRAFHDRNLAYLLARALSIPLSAVLLALLLLNTQLLPVDSVPEIFGGERLRRGLRIIAVVFGLSCLPGGLVGVAIGSLISPQTRISAAAIEILRFAQWLPFLIWWVLVPFVFVTPDQQFVRYFLVWTIAVPAVALGTCYHFLCARSLLQYDWPQAVAEGFRLSVLRDHFVSLILALSVWGEFWTSLPAGPLVQHFLVFFIVGVFQVVVSRVYQSALEETAKPRRKIFDQEANWGTERSTALTASLVVLLVVFGGILSGIGAVQVSLLGILKAAARLVVTSETWSNIGVSLLEILSGLIVSALVTLALFATISNTSFLGRILLRMLPMTFIAPIVLLPVWLFWLAYNSLNFTLWIPSCVAVFCFYPLIQAFWAMLDKPLLGRFLLAAEDALPYAFAGMIFGEAMNSTAGLGFAMVIAGATSQPYVGLAIFLVAFLLFVFLMLAVRVMMTRLYASD